MGDSHTSAGHSAVCEWRWVIKTRLVQGCSWQPHQNFQYPPVTSADCFFFFWSGRLKPKYIFFTAMQSGADRKIVAFLESGIVFGVWPLAWCEQSGFCLLTSPQFQIQFWCLIWMCQFWHAWHLVLMIFRAVFHVVFPEETNSDMFNRENNIELSAILILCLGLIIKTLNVPFCTILRAFFSCRNLVNRGLMCINIYMYVYVHMFTYIVYIYTYRTFSYKTASC